LAMTCLLVEIGGKKILVETGAGTPAKYDAKEQGFFKFSPHWVLDSLKAIGVEREAVDYVILTHLHFDHAGGGTMPDGPLTSDVKGGRGGHVPTFPRARYIVQRGEWEDAVKG
jgi:glyoxylase-like metal-dependent hydrolase (beta-lactamase superfamily II)